MGEFVRVEVADGIATIRLDRPKMNAISAQVQDEIADAAAQVSRDDSIHAVVRAHRRGGRRDLGLDLRVERVHLRPVQPDSGNPVRHLNPHELAQATHLHTRHGNVSPVAYSPPPAAKSVPQRDLPGDECDSEPVIGG